MSKLEALGRFELPTCGLGNRRSIHLSYRATDEREPIISRHRITAGASARSAALHLDRKNAGLRDQPVMLSVQSGKRFSHTANAPINDSISLLLVG